jgi:hypothetical protein
MRENHGDRPGGATADGDAPDISGLARPGERRDADAPDDETDTVTFIERIEPSHRPGDG